MSLPLTNGQVGDLIDGLRVAIAFNKTVIKSETPTSDAREAREHEEMTAQASRWRKLRKLLLEHERRS